MYCVSPAKINLSLRILGKLPNGYHELETLMAPLALADELEISLGTAPGVEIHCAQPGIPTDPENLVWKALAAFAEATGTPLSYHVELLKIIPAGGGLGGGSSNAAIALGAANQLHGEPLTEEQLLGLAGGIGSDVAFFRAGGWAMCRGRGEIVSPVQAPGTFPILLMKPPFPVPTPWAYRNWADSRELPGIDYRAQKVDELELVNDLERPVFAKYLILAHMKEWLRQQPEVRAAMMSGSGATMFAILEGQAGDSRHAELVKDAAEEFGPEVWVRLTQTEPQG